MTAGGSRLRDVLRTAVFRTQVRESESNALRWLTEVFQQARQQGVEVVRLEVHAPHGVTRAQVEADPFNTAEDAEDCPRCGRPGGHVVGSCTQAPVAPTPSTDTAPDLAAIEARHHPGTQQWSDGTTEQLCAFCGVEWPCDTGAVLTVARQLDAQIERLATDRARTR